MDRKLLIKTLEMLEETYPADYSIERLTSKLNVPIDGEFFKIVRHLELSKKVHIRYENVDRRAMKPQQGDRIVIMPDGIDFLTEIKIQESREMMNKLIVIATIVIALSAIVTLL